MHTFALFRRIVSRKNKFSAVANLVAFFLMRKFGMDLNKSIIAAFAISAFINYLLCIAILFRHKARWSSFGEIVAYIVTLLIMGGLDWAVTTGLIAAGLGQGAAKTLSVIVGFFGNYILRRVLVFPEKK